MSFGARLRRRPAVPGGLEIRPARSLLSRILLVLALVLAAVVLAYALFDAGRRAAGFNESDNTRVVSDLRQSIAELRSDLEEAQRSASTAESMLQVERASQSSLAGIVKGLEAENARLKGELAVFERIAGGDTTLGEFVISRIDVRPDSLAGTYRYRMLLARTGPNATKEFSGRLEFVATVRRGAETLIVTRPENSNQAPIAVSFKRFTHAEGSINVGAVDAIVSVEVRLVEGTKVRASEIYRP